MDTDHLKKQMTVPLYHNVSGAKIRQYFGFVQHYILLICIIFAVNMIEK
jgi:hypothetical protein